MSQFELSQKDKITLHRAQILQTMGMSLLYLLFSKPVITLLGENFFKESMFKPLLIAIEVGALLGFLLLFWGIFKARPIQIRLNKIIENAGLNKLYMQADKLILMAYAYLSVILRQAPDYITLPLFIISFLLSG